MSRVRMTPTARKAQLLSSAVKLAESVGYMKVTRVAIAADTGTTEGLVNRYLGNKSELRGAILRQAIKTKNKRIIAQGEGLKNPIILRAKREGKA